MARSPGAAHAARASRQAGSQRRAERTGAVAWSDSSWVSRRREPAGHLAGGGAGVGHAVGDADAAEAGAGDEEPGQVRRAGGRSPRRGRGDPTSCCAFARSQRCSRVKSGAPRMPSSAPISRSDAATSSSSLRSIACGSRAPPMNVRSRTRPSGRAHPPLRRDPRARHDRRSLDARAPRSRSRAAGARRPRAGSRA